MKTLERGQDKIQKICDKIRRETIEPAKEDAQQIIQAAKQKAEEIIADGEKHAGELIKQARAQIEQERNVFHSSLQQAAKQTIESLRQTIEQKLFSEELQSLLEIQLSDPNLIANLINSIVKAIDKDGISSDISVVIPRTVAPDDVLALLVDSVRKKLKNKPLEIGPFAGGVQVKLQDKKMRLDFTERTLQEWLSNYVRKDFRHYLFGQ